MSINKTILIFMMVSCVLVCIIAYSPKSYQPYAYSEWTPTITNGANVSTSTAHSGNYIRIGNKVIFSVIVDVNPTAGLTSTAIDVSLPIASNFNSVYDASGTNSGDDGSVLADGTNDRLDVDFVSNVSGDQVIGITGTYWIK